MQRLALLLLILLFLAAALIVYIRFDESLTPLAEKVLHYQPAPVPAAQNAFVGLSGLAAPAGSDFLRVGEENIQQAKAGQSPRMEEAALVFSDQDYRHACVKARTEARTENCLAEIRADEKNIRKLLQENHELIQRYLKIQQMPRFSNSIASVPLEVSLDFQRHGDLVRMFRLLGAQAMLDFQNGREEEALRWIQNDMAFYRRIYAEKDAGLIDKMVAIANLRSHAILLGLLLEEGLRAHPEKARALLLPLDAPRENFREAMWREHVNITQGLRTTLLSSLHVVAIDKPAAPLNEKLLDYLKLYLFYKSNMTTNLMTELHDTRMEIIAAMPASLLPSAPDTVDGETLGRVMPGCWIDNFMHRPFYCKRQSNFVGEILAQVAKPEAVDYLLRIYDTDAYLRLARARLEYDLTAKKPGEDVPEILARLPPETFNPYTNAPFDWNAREGTIGFQPAARADKERRVEIRLAPPAQAPKP